MYGLQKVIRLMWQLSAVVSHPTNGYYSSDEGWLTPNISPHKQVRRVSRVIRSCQGFAIQNMGLHLIVDEGIVIAVTACLLSMPS